MGKDLVGRTVSTGSRNRIQNQEMMASDNITLPVKPYSFSEVTRGERDTTLGGGGTVKPTGK